MKKILALLLVTVMMLSVPTSVFAAEAETDALVIEQQKENKTILKFENKLANFKNFGKEAIREKLDKTLIEGKITQEKYDAIVSGEWRPDFDGEKKFPIFRNKKAYAENKITDETRVKTRFAFGKKINGKFPSMRKGFKFMSAKR